MHVHVSCCATAATFQLYFEKGAASMRVQLFYVVVQLSDGLRHDTIGVHAALSTCFE